MAVLSIMSLQGDPDELLARMEATIEPVAARKAPQFGGISSTVVRTDDGITIYNLWSDDEGRHKLAEDQEMQEALRAADFPQPRFVGYQVLSHRSVGELGKKLAQRLADDVWSAGKLEVIDELVAPNAIGYDPVNGESRGPKGMRENVEKYRAAFPDMTMTIDRLVADGDWTAAHWTATGTHTGDLMGMAATGKQATVTGVTFHRIGAEGKFVEARTEFDALGMLQQIGALPAPAAASA